MQSARTLAILLLGLPLVGCVFPTYKALQPWAQMTVLDEGGRPIEGATVVLMSRSNPHYTEKGQEVRTTDQRGIAAFDQRSEWRTESLLPHGVEVFFWNWCVHKPGFKTYLTRHGSGHQFDAQPIIELVRGSSSPCPAAQVTR